MFEPLFNNKAPITKKIWLIRGGATLWLGPKVSLPPKKKKSKKKKK